MFGELYDCDLLVSLRSENSGTVIDRGTNDGSLAVVAMPRYLKLCLATWLPRVEKPDRCLVRRQSADRCKHLHLDNLGWDLDFCNSLQNTFSDDNIVCTLTGEISGYRDASCLLSEESTVPERPPE